MRLETQEALSIARQAILAAGASDAIAASLAQATVSAEWAGSRARIQEGPLIAELQQGTVRARPATPQLGTCIASSAALRPPAGEAVD